jgi:hypothetical protein
VVRDAGVSWFGPNVGGQNERREAERVSADRANVGGRGERAGGARRLCRGTRRTPIANAPEQPPVLGERVGVEEQRAERAARAAAARAGRELAAASRRRRVVVVVASWCGVADPSSVGRERCSRSLGTVTTSRIEWRRGALRPKTTESAPAARRSPPPNPLVVLAKRTPAAQSQRGSRPRRPNAKHDRARWRRRTAVSTHATRVR